PRRVATWQVSGPTVQEYDAPNVVMRDYLCCAAVLEQRRIRAEDLGLPAPRVLVCGSAFSGKSTLCQILCNYALRREHTPIFVDLDTRYSNTRQLQGMPACVTAMTVDHAADEEPLSRMAYFFGHLDWSDNARWYQRVVSHLSRVVSAKLSTATSREGARTSSSGLVVNAPFQPTPALLEKIIEMFEIDVVLVLDSEGLHAALCKMFAGCPKVNGVPKVEVVLLPKAPSADSRGGETCCMCTRLNNGKTWLYAAGDYSHAYGSQTAHQHCNQVCSLQCQFKAGHKFGCFEEQQLQMLSQQYSSQNDFYILHEDHFGSLC
ncbi:unnamed protein product, partial [Effrenium voratum]